MEKLMMRDAFKDDYITRQAGERLRKVIAEKIRRKEGIHLDFRQLLIGSTSFFDEAIAKLAEEGLTPKDFNDWVKISNLNKNDAKVLEMVTATRRFEVKSNLDTFGSRLCPVGHHWVREHERVIIFGQTIVDGHCRLNPGKRDVYSPDELHELWSKRKVGGFPLPSANDLEFGPKAQEFDEMIGFWVDYWNHILKPEHPIKPNMVKALMATESSFDVVPKVPRGHKAIGLLQLMPETIKLLNSDHELKSAQLDLSGVSVSDPVINIAAGVRWLFRKMEILKAGPNLMTDALLLEDHKGIVGDDSQMAKDIRDQIAFYLNILDKK